VKPKPSTPPVKNANAGPSRPSFVPINPLSFASLWASTTCRCSAAAAQVALITRQPHPHTSLFETISQHCLHPSDHIISPTHHRNLTLSNLRLSTACLLDSYSRFRERSLHLHPKCPPLSLRKVGKLALHPQRLLSTCSTSSPLHPARNLLARSFTLS
jgi:hypothetical protein